MPDFLTIAQWSPLHRGSRHRNRQLPCICHVRPSARLLYRVCQGSGADWEIFSADKTMAVEYYLEIVPKVDWPFMIIPGIIIGAFFLSYL